MGIANMAETRESKEETNKTKQICKENKRQQ